MPPRFAFGTLDAIPRPCRQCSIAAVPPFDVAILPPLRHCAWLADAAMRGAARQLGLPPPARARLDQAAGKA